MYIEEPLNYLDYHCTATVYVTVLTCKPNETLADVAVLPVDARPVVLTGLGCALVDVNVTVVTLETRYTVAVIHINTVLTDGAVPAGLRHTLIDVFFTVLTPKACGTPALVPVWCPHAGGVIVARVIRTVSHLRPAVVPTVSAGTVAGISVNSIHAVALDPRAGAALTFIDVLGAVGSVKPVGTQTGVVLHSWSADACRGTVCMFTRVV